VREKVGTRFSHDSNVEVTREGVRRNFPAFNDEQFSVDQMSDAPCIARDIRDDPDPISKAGGSVRLISFRVTNFRSVNNSGPIKVGKLTTLVGRNESGKTNLLLALQSLNPPGGPQNLSPIKDFPRGRRLSECTDETEVVETVWQLDAEEQKKLATVFPRSKGVAEVLIGRRYNAEKHRIEFRNLSPVPFDHAAVTNTFRTINGAAQSASQKLEAGPKGQLETALRNAESAVLQNGDPDDWSARAKPALLALQQAITTSKASLALQDSEIDALEKLVGLADKIAKDDVAFLEARKWIITQLPVFVYVDEYPELDGHQNIDEYLNRKENRQSTPADINFEKLCKVADLRPQQLKDLLAKNDHETRNQLANRAGAIVTSEIRRLWKDRALKVRFNPDAAHLDTLISDPNAVYDVEVNLDERSRGFKWFFSFYVIFSADTKGGSADNAVLLLDEPGLYLHASSQGDLLKHFAGDFKNQVLYTTHSPFMVPTENLDSVRTVNIEQDQGTTVTNDPSGDARTLFPIQAALGFHIAQTLFVGPNNLVIEGVTDYWIMSALSEYFRSINKPALPRSLTLTPAGGAQKIPYMVALLTSERLNVMALLDDEGKARATRDDLVKQKLIRDDNVLFVTEGFHPTRPNEADIEDLLDPTVYASLVNESYQTELSGKTLNLNAHIPRIVKRYEEAFEAIGLEFYKSRPARLLLDKMATSPATILTSLTVERFHRLFEKISAQLARHVARAASPFR
jgi:predicted ATP-dependent endonuclease of OLD family